MPDTKNIIIFILVFILMILIIGLISQRIEVQKQELKESVLNLSNFTFARGYNIGQIALIQQIQQSGEIPLFSNETGELTIKLVKITDLCGVQQQ